MRNVRFVHAQPSERPSQPPRKNRDMVPPLVLNVSAREHYCRALKSRYKGDNHKNTNYSGIVKVRVTTDLRRISPCLLHGRGDKQADMSNSLKGTARKCI